MKIISEVHLITGSNAKDLACDSRNTIIPLPNHLTINFPATIDPTFLVRSSIVPKKIRISVSFPPDQTKIGLFAVVRTVVTSRSDSES
jgi:hypothetical protein